MIKANELRIGNWIELKNSGHVRVDSDNIADIVNNYAIFEPIPLAPEILESYGFEDGILRIEKGTIFISINSANNGRDVVLRDVHNNSISRYYQYLHQLQNLYFSLTGQELEVNLLMKNTMPKS